MQKKIILLFLFLALKSGLAQEKKKPVAKKYNKEYFDIENYKDWETDSTYALYENDKFLKKGTDRIQISIDEKRIQVEKTSVIHPYEKYSVYYATTKALFASGIYFYQFRILKNKVYDENGKMTEGNDNDKPYKFSLKKLIQKFKKGYHVDLEDSTLGNYADRFESEEFKGKAFYEVRLLSEENKNKMRYYLIDGTTGKLLYKTFYYIHEGRSPFYEYQRKLDNHEEIPDKYLLTFKGKDYTRNEWDAYERAFYKKYKGTKKITDP